MKTFLQFILEYPLSYYENLQDADPPADVLEVEKEFALDSYIHWKWLKSKQFKHSYELQGGIIAMRPEDIKENWFHELGHQIWDNAGKRKIKIKPLLDRIKEQCRPSKEWLKKQKGHYYKWLQLGEYKYSYSQSGRKYEYDEIFAITFAFVEMGGKFDDVDLQSDYEDMLEILKEEESKNN